MTRLWKENGFVENDAWVLPVEGEPVAEGAKVIYGFEEFLAAAEASNESGFGVLVKPADDVTKLGPYLDRISLVAVAFPAFNDGRGFSHASLLRSRLAFDGEVRAVGDVLIDQVPLMLRCGFDSFAVTNPTAIRRLEEKRLPGISLHYQPATRASKGNERFSWRRKAS